jgi:uncharacterized membrane-anchored protein YjiN (DUF445 family)
MKALALGLLVLAGVVYGVATAAGAAPRAWGYVAAAAEAAMIGALADWFAVVALFRHPLGLPIPHTAIIVANKDRLGAQLARFLGEHFLAAEHVRPTLLRWDMAGALGQWLAQPQSARRVGQWLQQATPALLGALDQTPARQWVAQLAQRLLREVDLATLGGQALAALTAHGHHQQWLNGLLQQLSAGPGKRRCKKSSPTPLPANSRSSNTWGWTRWPRAWPPASWWPHSPAPWPTWPPTPPRAAPPL